MSKGTKCEGQVCSDDSVCFDEAVSWRECTQRNIKEPKKISAMCDSYGDQFDVCVKKWRDTGCTKKLKGAGVGDPPNQCAGMSCLIARCVEENNYNFDLCTTPSSYFKRCVTGLYGSPYIMV